MSRTSHAAPRLAYDPALDGIRAIAVVAVMLYHAEIGWASGGFLGVDLFFVLSGYLITTLLVLEQRTDQRINLVSFWARRARRLLPALIAMVAWVVVFARWLEPDTSAVNGTRNDAVAALFYVANWWNIAEEASYFALFTEPTPLLHTWSLAIEEQWYIVWPLVVWLWARRSSSPRSAQLCCIAATIASATLMALLADADDPSRAFFGTDTRGHSLLVGAALAFALADRSASAPSAPQNEGQTRLPRMRTADAVGFVGLAAFVAFAVVVTDDTFWMYRGGFLAASIASAAVIVGVRIAPRARLARLLSAGPLPAIGRLSYGLYLWHWPIYVLLDVDRTGLDGPGLVLVRIGVTVIVAVLSYRLIEQPIRHARPGRWLVPIGLGAATVAVALLAGIAIPSSPAQAPGSAVRVAAGASVEPDQPTATSGRAEGTESVVDGPATAGPDAGTSSTTPTAESGAVESPTEPSAHTTQSEPASAPTTAPSSSPRAQRPTLTEERPVHALWLGDSVVLDLAISYPEEELGDQMRVSADVVIGCGTLRSETYDYCLDRVDSWERSIAEDQPDVIVLAVSTWDAADPLVDNVSLAFGSDEWQAFAEESWQQNLDLLLSADLPVVVVSVHCVRWLPDLQPEAADRADPERTASVNRFVKEIVDDVDDVRWLDLRELTCPDGTYLDELNGVPLHRDGVHFTKEAIVEMWPWIVDRILAPPQAPR